MNAPILLFPTERSILDALFHPARRASSSSIPVAPAASDRWELPWAERTARMDTPPSCPRSFSLLSFDLNPLRLL